MKNISNTKLILLHPYIQKQGTSNRLWLLAFMSIFKLTFLLTIIYTSGLYAYSSTTTTIISAATITTTTTASNSNSKGLSSMNLVNTDPTVISGEENSGSGSDGAYSSTAGLLGCNQNGSSCCYGEAEVKEVEETKEGILNKDAIAIMEENEVQKLSEELMAYENMMKFYQIPYLDGQSTATQHPPAQEGMVGDLWSFDDDRVSALLLVLSQPSIV